jgi:excisionase family DNA binding protein
MAKLLYRPDEVAEMLNISNRTLRRMMADRQIAIIWIRGQKRIHQTELEKVLLGEMARLGQTCPQKYIRPIAKRPQLQRSQKLAVWVSQYGPERLARDLRVSRSSVYRWVAQTDQRCPPRIETAMAIVALSKIKPLLGEALTIEDIMGKVKSQEVSQ